MLRRFSFNKGVPLFSNLAGIWYFFPEQTACGGEWTYGVCEFWDVKNSDTWNTSNMRWVLFFFHFWPFSWSLNGDLDLQDLGAHPYFTLLSPWNNSNFVCNAGFACMKTFFEAFGLPLFCSFIDCFFLGLDYVLIDDHIMLQCRRSKKRFHASFHWAVE